MLVEGTEEKKSWQTREYRAYGYWCLGKVRGWVILQERMQVTYRRKWLASEPCESRMANRCYKLCRAVFRPLAVHQGERVHARTESKVAAMTPGSI